MKFGKRLKHQIQETLPEWRDYFLSYKNLKKLVRLISSTTSTQSKADFVDFLNSEIDKFNAFFMEQEEDFIIRQKELQERIQTVEATVGPTGSHPSQTMYKEEMGRIRKEIVNFYGEMVLLENYSNINYTGITKILKKYDKRTGSFLRLLFIQKVLTQPFFTTSLISKLMKECENTMDLIFPAEPNEGERELEREATMLAEQTIFRNTVAALATMREMRSGSSTYSPFSLPPLDLLDSDIIEFLQNHSPIPII